MMKIVFKGKSSEYEIQRSCFCVDAFVIKDKIEERDGVDFITSNVDLLEFDDDSFTFEEIVKHFNICDSEDMIIVEDFDMKSNKNNQNQEYDIEHDILKSEKIIHENTKQTRGITQINDSVAQIDQTTKDNVEIANESAIISSTVSDIANNILEDVKKKRF